MAVEWPAISVWIALTTMVTIEIYQGSVVNDNSSFYMNLCISCQILEKEKLRNFQTIW